MALDTLDNTAIELGLDIENYSGKWKQAKKMAFSMDKRDYDEENAFRCACRLFLELGGEKIKPSLETVLRDILNELLGTANLTTGAVAKAVHGYGHAAIKLEAVVTETNLLKVFRKYGVGQPLENAVADDTIPPRAISDEVSL